MLFFGIKKTVRLNKKKTKEFPLGNSLVHTVIVCSLWLGALGWTCWCCTIKVDIENSKGQYIEKDKQEATKDGSESTKIQHGI